MKAIILDTETTGVENAGLIEAAWLAVDNPRDLVPGEEFCARFNPGKVIGYGAMAVHHITNEDIADCPSADDFALPEGTEYVIGHNIDFDWKVIGEPKVKRICTLAFCRQLWPESDSHTLGAMLYLIEGPTAREALRNAHSARADVHVCRSVLSEILSLIGEPATWEEVWQKCEVARVPVVMPYGKHKGMPIKSVPRDYKQWLLRQPDVDPYLRK